MKKFGEFICKNKIKIMIISFVLIILSFIGMNLTKVNYDILVYLPQDIETIKGQNILTDDFKMGAYSIAVVDNASSNEILKIEEKIKQVEGVNKVASIYDVLGTQIPVEILPTELSDKVHKEGTDLLLITFNGSTSSEETINAVSEIRKITDKVSQGGMSSMVLDTMNLSEKEIFIYIVIAVILCIIVLELSFDSYIVPLLLLANIGCAILFNLGSNIFLGDISYITKALVAVLQLGVTTDFSIFLYHSYENEKQNSKNKEEAMATAIRNTFVSVAGSSLTTIAGFLVLCTMQLTLGKDLGIVMAKGVLLGVFTVLTLFPSLLLIFDKLIEKTKHKSLNLKFNKLNKFIIKHHIAIFVIFLTLLIPTYLAYSKVEVYYKLDKSLPDTLESIKTNEILKKNYNIVSPEIILINRNIKNDTILKMVAELENTDGVDLVLSASKISELGITDNMLDDNIKSIFENDKYQMMLINSTYDIATDELNEQTVIINNIVKKYDENGIVAGEAPLMKDLIEISDTDFNNVNTSSIICIFVILFFVLKSISLPFLLIATIEFAIFTNMSISYFSGSVLPFIAPIVLGTIQLGATIDYAILMTTSYLEKRKNGIEKKEAMLEVLNYSGTSIFVSAMCFFAATFGVGLYSKIEMIGSLCTLISRGALISMIVVVTILPSILLIFDKLIIKTTYKMGKEITMKKQFKKNVKKLASLVLITGILFSSMPVKALTKNETVYSKLNADGSQKTILVNEQILNQNKVNNLEDYSELSNILNLNDANTFTKNNNSLIWNTKGNDVFYQGNTTKSLPVNLNITYALDGKMMSASDMLGKSGKVTITLKYTNNDSHKVKMNGKTETLYTPFVVTFATIIDGQNNSNISVVNGKSINNGTNNIVGAIAAPGLYESLDVSELKGLDTITITYETTKFELASMYSVITPKLLGNDDLKIFTKMDELYSKISSLQTNMNKLDEGAQALATGTNKLYTELSSSIADLKQDTSSALTSVQISAIRKQTVATVKSKFTADYEKNLANKVWSQVAKEMNPNDQNVVNMVTSSVTNAVVEYLKNVNEYNDYVNCETGSKVAAAGGTMTSEQMASCMIIKNDAVLPLIQKAATTSATSTATNVSTYVAQNIAKKVAVSVAEESALETASNVAETLAPEVADQVKTEAVKTFSSSLTELYDGIKLLNSKTSELSSGITKFNDEGIKQLSSLVNTTVKNLSERVKALIKLGNDYQTIDSDSVIDGETKFVLVTDSLKVPVVVNKINTTTTKMTLWQRIKNLF